MIGPPESPKHNPRSPSPSTEIVVSWTPLIANGAKKNPPGSHPRSSRSQPHQRCDQPRWHQLVRGSAVSVSPIRAVPVRSVPNREAQSLKTHGGGSSDWQHRSFKTRFRTKAHPDVFGLCVWDTMPGSCNKAVCDQCAGAKWVTVDICEVHDGEDLGRGK